MPALFVDTSAFYAVADKSDRHHAAARRLFLARGVAGDLISSDYVFVESWCLIRARLGRAAAMAFWDAMETGVVKVLGLASEHVVRAKLIARSWPDQDFSLVDCTSFALMESHHLHDAMAFDAHFRIYRFGDRRQRSFNILPDSDQ